jgi:hypothetical protein
MSAIIFGRYLSEFFYEWILVFCDTAVHCWVIGSQHTFAMSRASHSDAELHGKRLESSVYHCLELTYEWKFYDQ